jgi:hypothetical protein
MQPSHITTVVSHKEICRAGGGFDPRIEQMAERADVPPDVHDGHGSVYSLASYSRITYRRPDSDDCYPGAPDGRDDRNSSPDR